MSGLVERTTIGAGAVSRGRRVVTIKRLLAGLAVTLGLIAATTFGVRYWEVGRFQVETDDAYVQANSIIIAPRVPGYIAEVLVNDNQPVKAGQVLARIDDRDLRTALDQASADRDAAEHKVANLAAQLQLQQSLIDEAAAQGHRLRQRRPSRRRTSVATATWRIPAPAASSRRSRRRRCCCNGPPICNARMPL